MCFQKKQYANRNNFTVFATVQNQQQYGKILFTSFFLFNLFCLLIILKFCKQRLISIERSHRHQIGQRFMMLVRNRNKLWYVSQILDAFDVHRSEERVIQNTSC